MPTELRAKQLDKIVAISAARKLRKQAALAETRSELVGAEHARNRAAEQCERAIEALKDARIAVVQRATSDQVLLWRRHCENKQSEAIIALDDAKDEVADANAVLQIAIDDLLRHNFRHDRIVEHANKTHRQLSNLKEARSDDEFTDSRSASIAMSLWDNE
jgi:predicted ATP-grasp superfamily ATP-dependent carboligase